jgi:D-sedoheptulose 7-phosphate isomerase
MSYFDELQQVLSRLDPAPLLPFVQGCEGTLWLAGNGGSASIAQHWACDLSKAAGRRAQALGANPAVLTAWSNDESYAAALRAELQSLAREDDRLILMSCSGRSANIVQLISEIMPCYLITGCAAPAWAGSVKTLVIPHTHYGIIEDCFGAIGHWLTEALCTSSS